MINEYGWLWINRDGSLPTLTVEVYKQLLGENASVDARRLYYARTLAAKTEFWRVRRQCCGVLHFCGLGYSRADGQTSDNFLDVKNLTYEPHFYQFVRDAFAPVGVAIDFWQDQLAKNASVRIPVRVINDLANEWSGEVVLRLVREGQVVSEQKQAVQAAGWELGTAEFEVKFPAEEARCSSSPRSAAPTDSRSAACAIFASGRSPRTWHSAGRSRRRPKSGTIRVSSLPSWRWTAIPRRVGRRSFWTSSGCKLTSERRRSCRA